MRYHCSTTTPSSLHDLVPSFAVSLQYYTFQLPPSYWNSLFHHLISLGRMQHIFCSWSHSHSANFISTWYPLLLDEHRQCEFKTCTRLVHMTSTAGIESQIPWPQVQCLNHSVTRSTQTSRSYFTSPTLKTFILCVYACVWLTICMRIFPQGYCSKWHKMNDDLGNDSAPRLYGAGAILVMGEISWEVTYMFCRSPSWSGSVH